MDFLSDNLSDILNVIILVLATFLPLVLVKLNKILVAIKESSDVVTSFKNALADNRFTDEEVADLRREIDEAKGAWKDVITRKVS